MVDSASSSDAEKAQSYIGCLVRLFTKSEIRYEGFVFSLDCNDRTIGIRNVKSYGTEGRRKDGPQVPATERLFEYIYFRGSDIKDLHVLSSPSAQSTSALPDDPAIIKPQNYLLPAATLSLVTPSTFQAKNTESSTQSAVQAAPFQGNLLSQSVGVSVSHQVPTVPAALSVNVSWPTSTNYWHQFSGIPEGTSCSQPQAFTLPPHPQGFMLTNTTQQTMQHIGMNTASAGSSSNITEEPHPSLPTVCTSSLPLIATLPPPSSIQCSNASFAQMFSNMTINSMENKASSTLPTAMVISSSQAVSSSGANPVVPPVIHTGQSVLRPHPIIPRTVSSTVGISSAVDWKPSMTSHPSMQAGLTESSSSHHSKDGNNDATIIVASISQNTKEVSPELPKALNTEMHGPASSSHYINRSHIQDRGDGIHQNNRGRSQGRGDQGDLSNRGYQRYRSSVERGKEKIGAPLHPQHHVINPGRGYAPNPTWYPHSNAGGYAFGRGSKPNPAWYPRHHVGGQAFGGGSESSLPVAKFTEDFDFEKMNQKFNKEEVWDLFGKSKSAEGDDDDGNASDAKDEAGDVLPKHEQPIYSKGDFFDSISCRSLEAQSAGRGKMNMSEQRRLDVETFGEIRNPHRGRGVVMRPPRGGRSWGPYRGRGSGPAGRGHPINYWNRVTKD